MRLLREHIGHQHSAVTYALDDVEAVLRDAAVLLHEEPQLVHVPRANSTSSSTNNTSSTQPVFINVFGDIYAHYKCMWKLFAMSSNFPPSLCHQYVFLGNYTTHTSMSDAVLQTVVTLLLLKLLYPAHCTLLRGEFEDEAKLNTFKLPQYMRDRGVHSATAWADLVRCMHNMPMAAVIDRQFIAVHSGVGPALAACNHPLREINAIAKGKSLRQLYGQCAIAKELIMFYPRMANELYDEQFTNEQLKRVLAKAKLHGMLRGGSLLLDGACYPFATGGRVGEPHSLLSLFSAANLCGDFTNAAAIAIIGRHMPTAIRSMHTGNVLIARLDMERVTLATDALSVTETATTVGHREQSSATHIAQAQVHVQHSPGTGAAHSKGHSVGTGASPSPPSDAKPAASTSTTPQAHDNRTQTQKRGGGTTGSLSTAKMDEIGGGTATLSSARRSKSRSKVKSTRTAKSEATSGKQP